MVSTVILVACILGMHLTSIALWAAALRIGLRWAIGSDIGTARVLAMSGGVHLAQAAMTVAALSLARLLPSSTSALLAAELAMTVIVQCGLIGIACKTSPTKAFTAWLPTLVATAAVTVFVFLVLRPFVFEAFAMPFNSMAPTLLGRHYRGTCAECGQPNAGSPPEDRGGESGPTLMICESFHVTEVASPDRTTLSGDHFLAAKFLAPRRWDLVVFAYPQSPDAIFVSRLVGLPGETLLIQDGAVWVNGEPLAPPESLRGLRYETSLPQRVWGPARLGDDEFFVLGDFSARSNDSRRWSRGAAGHNPFAVPQSHLRGVVTHTFWPFSRWRVHR